MLHPGVESRSPPWTLGSTGCALRGQARVGSGGAVCGIPVAINSELVDRRGAGKVSVLRGRRTCATMRCRNRCSHRSNGRPCAPYDQDTTERIARKSRTMRHGASVSSRHSPELVCRSGVLLGTPRTFDPAPSRRDPAQERGSRNRSFATRGLTPPRAKATAARCAVRLSSETSRGARPREFAFRFGYLIP